MVSTCDTSEQRLTQSIRRQTQGDIFGNPLGGDKPLEGLQCISLFSNKGHCMPEAYSPVL